QPRVRTAEAPPEDPARPPKRFQAEAENDRRHPDPLGSPVDDRQVARAENAEESHAETSREAPEPAARRARRHRISLSGPRPSRAPASGDASGAPRSRP